MDRRLLKVIEDGVSQLFRLVVQVSFDCASSLQKRGCLQMI